MIMPPGGFLTMGLMFLTMGWWGERKKAKLAEVAK
jgi:Na+-translocating ferredoxin:NAD+ oxidoreductase RnfE subunit